MPGTQKISDCPSGSPATSGEPAKVERVGRQMISVMTEWRDAVHEAVSEKARYCLGPQDDAAPYITNRLEADLYRAVRDAIRASRGEE